MRYYIKTHTYARITMKHIDEFINESMSRSTMNQLTSLNNYDTFIIVKPGFARYTRFILERFAKDGYTVVRDSAQTTRTIGVWRNMYAMHADKDFFGDLCTYMCHGEVQAFLLKSPFADAKRAVEHTSKIKDEIRSSWGKDDMHNVMHSSDSIENVYRESNIFFNAIEAPKKK